MEAATRGDERVAWVATGTGGEDGHVGELFGREDLQKLVMGWLRALKRGKR